MRGNIRKTITFAIVAALLIGALAGCGGAGKNEAGAGDLAYIKEQKSLNIGITIFDPMNYYDDSGKLVGFDTEFADAVCEKLGVRPEFIEINWDTKEVDLAAKSIDCIWNGLTVTEERKTNMDFTDSYIKNMQVVVVRAADKDKYTSIESLESARLCAEMSSAGETAIQAEAAWGAAPYTASAKQTDTLLEVKAGTADAAVLDYTAANALVGEGTSYSDLLILPGIELAAEEYAVGFRVGSDIVPEANRIIAELTANGALNQIAEKYGLTASLLSNQ
ncbi:MAG: transporter substrate-binding domain-containing protein [Clostridiales Family XIII bacterium]|nr:transporter substrate-binding domain-containing protein [Clostridiales Family XIII bacterium]